LVAAPSSFSSSSASAPIPSSSILMARATAIISSTRCRLCNPPANGSSYPCMYEGCLAVAGRVPTLSTVHVLVRVTIDSPSSSLAASARTTGRSLSMAMIWLYCCYGGLAFRVAPPRTQERHIKANASTIDPETNLDDGSSIIAPHPWHSMILFSFNRWLKAMFVGAFYRLVLTITNLWEVKAKSTTNR